jgi:hypothetical protein
VQTLKRWRVRLFLYFFLFFLGAVQLLNVPVAYSVRNFCFFPPLFPFIPFTVQFLHVPLACVANVLLMCG